MVDVIGVKSLRWSNLPVGVFGELLGHPVRSLGLRCAGEAVTIVRAMVRSRRHIPPVPTWTCPHTRTLSGMQANSDHPTSGHSRSTATVGRSAPFLSKRALSFSSLSCARLFGVSSSRYVPRFMTASTSDIQNMLPFYETQHPESLLKSIYQHLFRRLCNPECRLRTR